MNYVPGTGWWYSWVDWDPAAVGRDLDAIAQLGADHIRIHCLWPVFQPNANLVSAVMVERARELVEAASMRGLDVCVAVLDGWLSGFDFRPAWLGDSGNMFTDTLAIEAQRLLISELAAALNPSSAFLGFDVGNEVNVLSQTLRNPTGGRQGGEWSALMLEHIEAVSPGRLHTNGVDHNPWLTDGTTFDRPTLASTGSVTSVHAWSYFTGALERYGEGSTGVTFLSVFMLELAKAYHVDLARPVWLQEIGVAHQWLTATTPEDFTRASIEAASTVEDLWGITWWCSHDVDRRLAGFAELEYDLGLLTVDNVVKPMGRAFQEAAGRARSATPQRRERALVLRSGQTPDLQFADAFFAQVDAGRSPAIVLEERAADTAYLSSRGIGSLLQASHA